MARPTGVFKIRNEYVDVLGAVYADTPKAVFAAVAVSLLANIAGVDLGDVGAAIIKEWGALHEAGIVPQKPINQIAGYES